MRRESGQATADVCRHHGISSATFYKWKSKYGGLEVIDFENLSIEHPEVHHDLPEGGRRLMQRANGYEATIVSGTITQRNGQPTGELPGKMVLGKQAAPTRLAAE